jgi:malonyl-CoA/methylmalonyl-CoA synthetase
MMKTGIELMDRAGAFRERIAIDAGGRHHTYAELVKASERVAAGLLRALNTEPSSSLPGERNRPKGTSSSRIAFLIPGSFEHVAVQWGIWRAGGMAVPLNSGAPDPEVEYVLTNAEVHAVVALHQDSDRLGAMARSLGIPLLAAETLYTNSLPGPSGLPWVDPGQGAMMLYTSGTTSKPKGVVSSHANIRAQILALVEAWGWEMDDRIPLFLPLHHIHGIVNVLSCALWCGARVEAFPGFDLPRILDRVAKGAYTLFMAVPTIYVKLIRTMEEAPEGDAERWRKGFQEMRLMVSGSAALPAAIHQRWTELTSQKLLERYGMTEIGMGLSNPLRGERRPGAVGLPLPGVELRLVADGGEVIPGEGVPGEIQVRGPGVFAEYWRRPEATEAAFVEGWFRTGDMAVLEDGYYRILGRLSVDIIKSGGEKLSALEIEDVLREHPAVKEVAVVGVEDEIWGEAVAAAVIPNPGADLGLEELREWTRERVSAAKLPKRLKLVDDFPRNAMGKVMKPGVKDLFAPPSGLS